jgi:hypothetical protein
VKDYDIQKASSLEKIITLAILNLVMLGELLKSGKGLPWKTL